MGKGSDESKISLKCNIVFWTFCSGFTGFVFISCIFFILNVVFANEYNRYGFITYLLLFTDIYLSALAFYLSVSKGIKLSKSLE